MASHKRRPSKHTTRHETAPGYAYRLVITWPKRDPKFFSTNDLAKAKSMARTKASEGAHVELEENKGWGVHRTLDTYQPTPGAQLQPVITGGCPTPWKQDYATEALAQTQATADSVRHGTGLHTYRCICRHWHLTRSSRGKLPTDQPPRPEDVARIRALDLDAFTALVDGDIRLTARTNDRLALRHPDNLTRWRHTLRALRSPIAKEIAANPNADTAWRAKRQIHQNTIDLRLTECNQLRTQATTRKDTKAA